MQYTRAQKLRQSAEHAITKAVEAIHLSNFEQSRAWSALAQAHAASEQAALTRELLEAATTKGGC